MVAEYTYTNSAKSDPCQQFSPERRQARKAKSGRVLLKLCHRLKPTQRKARTTDMNTQALRIPFDPYDGYTPYPECQFDPIYAGPSVSHHIGFHIPDNRYVLEIPERLDTDALYSDHWQRFLDWAGDQGLSALPALPVVVAAYLTTLAEITNSLDARTAAEAIYSVHRWAAIPSPFDDPILQLITKHILRGYPPKPQSTEDMSVAVC